MNDVPTPPSDDREDLNRRLAALQALRELPADKLLAALELDEDDTRDTNE